MKKKTLAAMAMLSLMAQENVYAAKGIESANEPIDTTQVINEVEINGLYKKSKTLKIDVPQEFIPVSTNTLSANTLQNRNITDIQTASRFLPGVRIRTTYGAFQQIAIRGFDHSIIMVDGVRDERSSIDNSYPFMDLSAVQSIELIKGPQSVLYGTSAVGGVINVVRRSPSADKHVYTRLSYGSWNNMQAQIGLGGKLFGPINYLATFNYQNKDGWRDNKQSRLSGYFTAGGNLSQNDEINLRIGANDDHYATEIGLPPLLGYDIYNTSNDQLYLKAYQQQAGINRENRYNSNSDFMSNHGINVSAQYKHTFNKNFKLMEKFSYSHDDINYFGTEELDYLTSNSPIYKHYYTVSGGAKKYVNLDSIYYGYPLRFSHIADTYNNQLELSGEFNIGNIKNTYLAGYSMIFLRRTSYTGYNFKTDGTATPENSDLWGPGLTGVGSVYNGESLGWMQSQFSKATPQNRFQNGFYFHDVLDINRHWKAMIAGRFDLYNYKRISGLACINGKRDFNDVPKSQYSELSTSAFTFRAGAVYLPVDNLSLYASYGTYFKPIYTFYNPNYVYVDKNGNIFQPSNDGGEVFKPERGGQLELGFKYDVSRNLTVNGSFYYINKYNMNQSSKVDINGEMKTVYAQIGRMESKGFDIDVTWSPIMNLNLATGYGFTDARYINIASNPYITSFSNRGKQFAYIPKNTFFFLGDYKVSDGVLEGLGCNLSVSFQDKVYRNAANTSYFDAYWLTDFGISYEMPETKVRLGLNINNVFNKKYTNQSLGEQIVPSEPRNWMASVSYIF